jgi:iron complex transport system substrate-binding protein
MKHLFLACVVLLASLIPGGPSGVQATPEKPRRVVSLAPSVTETIFALGAEEQLVGICSFCDFPHGVERLARVGSYSTPNLEAILVQNPDLVIGVPPNNPEVIAALKRAGLNVVVIEVNTIAQIESSIRTIAREVGREAGGEQLLRQMHEKMAAIQARLHGAPQRRVLMVVGQNPLIAVGDGIFLNELITQARGTNIAAATGQPWPYLSLEFAIANLPEVIIDGSMGSEEKNETQSLGMWRNFPQLPAVKEGRLYNRRSAMLLRPGPRLAEGFEEIARFVHPERFQ